MQFTDRQLEDRILELIHRKYPRLHLTEEDISEMLFGDAFNRPHVNRACRRLVDEKRLLRDGRGIRGDPFWYRPYFVSVERKF